MSFNIVWLAAIAATIGACFSIREVEPPGNDQADWISPTDYPVLIRNLETAVAQRNTQNYLRCFAPEGLDFTPAASLFGNNLSIWRNWSIIDEQTWFDNMRINLVSAAGNSLSIREQDVQNLSGDSLRFNGAYTLNINHNISTLSKRFTGQVQFTIRLNTFNEWYISRWTDVEVQPDSSWSLLKLTFVR